MGGGFVGPGPGDMFGGQKSPLAVGTAFSSVRPHLHGSGCLPPRIPGRRRESAEGPLCGFSW